jgi:hypothetical protein
MAMIEGVMIGGMMAGHHHHGYGMGDGDIGLVGMTGEAMMIDGMIRGNPGEVLLGGELVIADEIF